MHSNMFDVFNGWTNPIS